MAFSASDAGAPDAGPAVRTRFSVRDEGDFHIGAPDGGGLLADRRRALAGHPWTWLRQVHGAEVVEVRAPGSGAGRRADAAVTATPGAVLAVHTADCVPVLLADPVAGVVGAAHVGWRGLVAGVLTATVQAMAGLGSRDGHAWIGPHIRARCYEFGPAELDEVAGVTGDGVRAHTAWGTPALDLAAGVSSVLADLGVPTADAGGCTACEPGRYWSHRARGDAGRHAAVVWLEP